MTIHPSIKDTFIDFKHEMRSHKFSKDKKERNYKVAEFLVKEIELITTYDNEQLYIYEDGYYQAKGESRIKEIIELILGEEASKHTVGEIIGHIKRKTYEERKIFDKTPETLICLKNGIFNLETFELEEHTPTIYFNTQIPVEYHQTAKVGLFKEFVRQVVNKEKRREIYEMIAYCLLRNNKFQKSFLLVGAGRNGKSTLLTAMQKLFGENNCTNIELQQLAENRFALSHLYGKHVNFFADLPQRGLRETGRFKALTGGDYVQGEKKFQDSFSFKPYAKLVFSANLLPQTSDDSDAFYRRWCIIPFPNRFEGKEADENLLEKITSKEELEGILKVSLNVLVQLLKQRGFTNKHSIEENRILYTKLSDPVGSFIIDKIETVHDSFVIKQELYHAFFEYCKKNNYPVISMRSFASILLRTVKAEDYYATLENKRIKCWRGIRYVVEEGEEDINKHQLMENF